MKARLPGGLPVMLAQLGATVLRRRLLLGYVASWWSRSHNLGPFYESSERGAYSAASLLYSSWGAFCPTDLVALPLLLHQTKTSSGADWKASAPWFAHFNTAGWCETLLYVRAQQPVDPTPSNRASDPGDIRRHDLLWRQWRSSVTAVLCVTNNANRFGDLERRNSLFQSYSEKTSLKYSLRAKLEIAEQQCSTPDTVAAVWDSRTEINPTIQMLRSQNLPTICSAQRSHSMGLESLTNRPVVMAPSGRMNAKEYGRINLGMNHEFNSKGGGRAEVVCRLQEASWRS
jgi:hypothetical protein